MLSKQLELLCQTKTTLRSTNILYLSFLHSFAIAAYESQDYRLRTRRLRPQPQGNLGPT